MVQWNYRDGNFFIGEIDLSPRDVIRILNNYSRCIAEAQLALAQAPSCSSADCAVLGLVSRLQDNPLACYREKDRK